jgi:hypothetical protein
LTTRFSSFNYLIDLIPSKVTISRLYLIPVKTPVGYPGFGISLHISIEGISSGNSLAWIIKNIIDHGWADGMFSRVTPETGLRHTNTKKEDREEENEEKTHIKNLD